MEHRHQFSDEEIEQFSQKLSYPDAIKILLKRSVCIKCMEIGTDLIDKISQKLDEVEKLERNYATASKELQETREAKLAAERKVESLNTTCNAQKQELQHLTECHKQLALETKEDRRVSGGLVSELQKMATEEREGYEKKIRKLTELETDHSDLLEKYRKVENRCCKLEKEIEIYENLLPNSNGGACDQTMRSLHDEMDEVMPGEETSAEESLLTAVTHGQPLSIVKPQKIQLVKPVEYCFKKVFAALLFCFFALLSWMVSRYSVSIDSTDLYGLYDRHRYV